MKILFIERFFLNLHRFKPEGYLVLRGEEYSNTSDAFGAGGIHEVIYSSKILLFFTHGGVCTDSSQNQFADDRAPPTLWWRRGRRL